MTEKPRKKAVALRYDPEVDPAPRVTAKGRGAMAERILAVARENGVPIHEDADLVEILGALDAGKLIPEAMYAAVAEILAFLYRANNQAKRKLI